MDNNLYAVLAGFGVLLILFILVIAIVLIVANWQIFSKADKPGWGSLIPIYNLYIMSDIAFGNKNYFIANLILIVVSYIGGALEISFLSSLASLITFVLYIIYSVKLSKAFGKGGGFSVGMVLLPFIFLPILGFGSAKYIGPQSKESETSYEI